MKNRAILIIGTIPETAGLGGVTIHVDRLIKAINKQKTLNATGNIELNLCDYKKVSYLKQLAEIFKAKVIHIHVSHPILRIFYVLSSMLFRTKSILTIHGNIGRFSAWKNYLDKLAIKLCNTPILLNQESYNKAKKWNKRSELISAFIPPQDKETLPYEIQNYIKEQKDKNRKIFVTNASKRAFMPDGREMYGIDFLVNYFCNKDNYCLIISDPTSQNLSFNKSQNKNNIKFITYQHSFYALMKESDAVIRATATDGDSLSIREALYLGKPIIATNCVTRPEGVIVYDFNNLNDFSSAIQIALNTPNQTNSKEVESIVKLIELYKQYF